MTHGTTSNQSHAGQEEGQEEEKEDRHQTNTPHAGMIDGKRTPCSPCPALTLGLGIFFLLAMLV